MDCNAKKKMLTREEEKSRLFNAIWKVAEAARGTVDGWDFKAYIFGSLFYRYLSELLCEKINNNEHEAGNTDFDYAKLSDEDIDDEIREEIIKENGYFLYPSEIFSRVIEAAAVDTESLNEKLDSVFSNFEGSSIGRKSEECFKGLFYDFDVNNEKLGATVIERNKKLLEILNAIGGLNLGKIDDTTADILGDAYEQTMGLYARNAGRLGGEYFTPSDVSVLVTKLALNGKKRIKNIYDPTCGSGSLLLKAAKEIGMDNIDLGFFGQDANLTSSRLCKINMFLHTRDYSKFDIRYGDTLKDPYHWDDQPFEAIVSNPPYSIKWDGPDDATLIGDPRFSPAGVLAPSSNADMAFIMHALSWLAPNGTASIVCFPSIMYRSGAEQKIRKYLIDNNFVDCIIQLPGKLFYGTSIPTCIMVLKKNKTDNKVLFIDASKEFIKAPKNNRLTEENIQNIMDAYENRTNNNYFSRLVSYDEIANKNNYNLSVSTYVEKEDTLEVIDINDLNSKINAVIEKENQLRAEIDKIIKEI